MVGTQQCIPGSDTHVYTALPLYPGSSYLLRFLSPNNEKDTNNDNVHNVLCLSSAIFITLMLVMHLRKTELKIPTDPEANQLVIYKRDRHVELGTIENKSSLYTDLPPSPFRRFPIFPEGKGGGGGVCIQARTNPTSRQGRT